MNYTTFLGAFYFYVLTYVGNDRMGEGVKDDQAFAVIKVDLLMASFNINFNHLIKMFD